MQKSTLRLSAAALFFTLCCFGQVALTAPAEAATPCWSCTVTGCQRVSFGADDCWDLGPNPWNCQNVGGFCGDF